MDPTAWNYSHNQLHHYHTGEPADPDLVERNLTRVRTLRAPRAIKYLVVLVGALTWKFAYYAPNVLNGLESKRRHYRSGAPHEEFINLFNFWDLRIPVVRALWVRNLLPYTLFHFVVIPALFLPLGRGAALAVMLNLVFAELAANLHTFIVIVPSHAASDLMSFEGPVRSKSEFYLRQILTTANYRTGGDVNDFLHMWINYQIEHHLFPDLPMSTYRKIQPEVAALCAKHGVPYVQESVVARLGKLLDVCIGRATLQRWTAPAPWATVNKLDLSSESPLDPRQVVG
jgi:fatty acid desaturase